MRPGFAVLSFLLFSRVAAPQQYVISTLAGGVPVPPTVIESIAVDAAGNIYFDGRFPTSSVFKLDPSGKVTFIAGSGKTEYRGDGGPATSASLYSPEGLAVDSAGNLYVADKGNHRVRRVSPDGIITTVAGGGSNGLGDGGPATSAQLSYPGGVAVDRAGNLFIGELYRVRKVTPDGIITTVAGGGNQGPGGGGPATSAQLGYAASVALDNAGNLFIQDPDIYRGNELDPRIRKVSPSGIITTVAGGGLCCYGAITVDGAGNLFTANENQAWRIPPGGTAAIVAGNGMYGSSGDGGPATKAQLTVQGALAVDAAGSLFLADGGINPVRRPSIRRISPNGIITTVPGGALDSTPLPIGDGGPATSALLEFVVGAGIHNGIAVDGSGNVFVAETYRHRIRKISAGGIITTVAGGAGPRCSGPSPNNCLPLGDGGPASSAALWYPSAVAVDNQGNLFIADALNYRVRKVSPDGIITTVAGNGMRGSSGDGGPATGAQLDASVIAVDGAGNLFVAASSNGVRKVSPDGIITTVFHDFAANLAADSSGNLFVVGTSCNSEDECDVVIQKLSATGALSTVLDAPIVVFGGTCTFLSAVALDSVGNLFVAQPFCNQIGKVGAGGVITIIAGQATGYEGAGYFGDGGIAINAALYYPTALTADGAGNIYFTDDNNQAVRVLRPAHQTISAVVDAASQKAAPISPGKIVVIYGIGLGPGELVQNRPNNGVFSTQLGGTSVSFNGAAAPVLYASATQVAAVVPYAITGDTAQVTVSYQGQASAAFSVPVAAAAPSLFTLNQTGAGQAAALNVADGTPNSAANPVKVGGYISLYATGEGRTSPDGVDGKVAGATALVPALRVSATIGGIPATVQYAGSAPGQVAGLMQVNVQVPSGVQPGGYVPVVLKVGEVSTKSGAVWVAIAGN